VNYAQAIVLGLVQGLTEFLPVSSSGHLVVAEAAVGLVTPGVVVEVMLHVATLLAVVIVYRQRLVELAVGCILGRAAAWRMFGLLALASIPAAVVGLALKDFFERAFDSLLVVGIDFVVTGIILWSTRRVARDAVAEAPGVGGAGAIGVAQAFAILPGISRSGTTVATALWFRVRPERAAEFSFLMALPAIAGAAVLELPHLSIGADGAGWGPLAAGFVAALVSGVFAIRFLVALLKRGAFHHFAPYCWVLGIATVVWAVVR
jgi:undecaprenyl-diphosphatase